MYWSNNVEIVSIKIKKKTTIFVQFDFLQYFVDSWNDYFEAVLQGCKEAEVRSIFVRLLQLDKMVEEQGYHSLQNLDSGKIITMLF